MHCDVHLSASYNITQSEVGLLSGLQDDRSGQVVCSGVQANTPSHMLITQGHREGDICSDVIIVPVQQGPECPPPSSQTHTHVGRQSTTKPTCVQVILLFLT